jgi:hypothetical protein
MGRWIIYIGVVILVIGLVVQFAPGLFSWFGKLPGDINIQTEHTRVFIPITSMILISVLLTILVNAMKFLINLFS